MQLNRRALIVLVAAIVFRWQVPTSAAADASASDRIVVMISVDGLAGFYLDDPKAEMPNIRALAAAGTQALVRVSTPSVTWPNHTTLVTGVPPALHGVVGNNYFDRVTKKQVALIGDRLYNKDEIVKVPTIYDAAKAAGLKTAAFWWPATRNAKTLDWTIPAIAADKLRNKYSTPGVLAECKAAGIVMDKATTKPADEQADPPSRDPDLTRVFILMLQKHRPNLALLHIAYVDHMQHLKGPRTPAAYAAIKAADEQVGQVWEELKRDYAGKATLLVVSDHGFSPIDHVILPNVVLRKAGLIKSKNKAVTGGDVHIVVQGGSALVYVLDDAHRSALIERVADAFKTVKGVSKIVRPAQLKDYGVGDAKKDPHAPDMVLFAEEGCVFGDTAAGDLPFVEKPERNGSHGHDPDLPDLHATFVGWGVGIKPGVKLREIDNTMIAPTIARLLGVSLCRQAAKPVEEALSTK